MGLKRNPIKELKSKREKVRLHQPIDNISLLLDEIKRFNQTLLNGKLDFESAKMVEPYLDENSVIFGPIGLGWEIVSLKGKLVASKTGLAFVESHIERQATARKICKLDTPETEFLSFLK